MEGPSSYSNMSHNNFSELHANSAFSFLNAASLPEDLAQAAAEKNLSAMALVDANGVYGAPRFFKACKEVNVRAIVGAEVTLDGAASRLTLLASSRTGYR